VEWEPFSPANRAVVLPALLTLGVRSLGEDVPTPAACSRRTCVGGLGVLLGGKSADPFGLGHARGRIGNPDHIRTRRLLA
jgi:hypothetical protein